MRFLDRLRGGDKPHRHSAEDLARLDETAPGWRAIDRAVDRLYPGVEPAHWGTKVRWSAGGPDPLDGISAYPGEGPRHWHYVTYGLSELYGKTSGDADVSGWGIELTFRLARTEGDAAPTWPWSLLQNLARYVFESGNVLSPGDHTDLNGPIALKEDTAIRAALFVMDPKLDPIDTPNGRISFVQVIGVTIDEYEAAVEWDTNWMVEILGERNPLLVTDVRRASLLDDANVRQQIADGIARDGSSMTGVNIDTLVITIDGESVSIHVGAIAVQRLRQLVRGRLEHDRSFWIRGGDSSVGFQRGESLSWHGESDDFHITVPEDVIRDMKGIPEIAGRYPLGDAGRLVFEVEQSIIRGSDDQEVSRIG